ncbi:O-antigen ligase family protein [Metabacillus arenae]|uniref:O-antigen ligase family protein n=1 Tax=Metabacillus arenae TaxID=2771434 RepID=A0A926S081_9BACI|nr:O-antigen ligase family protein [Metabacillus arenae]MBD1382997.1 O-antigen ligase family protein [Metabacillus arenae]
MIKLFLHNKMTQLIAGVLLSFILFLYLRYLSEFPLLAAAGIIIISTGILIIIKYIKFFWIKSSIRKILLSLLLSTAFLSGGITLAVLPGFSLFPYRLFLLILTLVYLIQWLKRDILWWKDIKVKPIIAFFFLWFLYSLVSLSWSASLSEGVKDITYLVVGISFTYYVVSIYNEKRNYVEFFFIWIIMTFALIGLGFLNHFLEKHLPISRINYAYSYQQDIPTAVFVNENDFASFLAIAIFFLVSLCHNHPYKILKFFGVIGILCSLLLIVLTESRANYISVAIGFAFWYLFMINLKLRVKLTILGSLAVVPIILFFSNRIIPIVQSVAVQVVSLFVPNEASRSVDIRTNLLKNIIVYIEDSFGFGVGSGNAEFYIENNQIYDTHGDYNVHNWWAEIFVNYGMFIFFLYVIMLVYLFVKLFRYNMRESDWQLKMITEALLCGLIVFLFASISPNSFMALTYNWIFVAFLIGVVQFYKKSRVKQEVT